MRPARTPQATWAVRPERPPAPPRPVRTCDGAPLQERWGTVICGQGVIALLSADRFGRHLLVRRTPNPWPVYSGPGPLRGILREGPAGGSQRARVTVPRGTRAPVPREALPALAYRPPATLTRSGLTSKRASSQP